MNCAMCGQLKGDSYGKTCIECLVKLESEDLERRGIGDEKMYAYGVSLVICLPQNAPNVDVVSTILKALKQTFPQAVFKDTKGFDLDRLQEDLERVTLERDLAISEMEKRNQREIEAKNAS